MNIMMQPRPTGWTADFSVSGTFDGLIPSAEFLRKKDAARELMAPPPRASQAAPCLKWMPYCIPVLDQRQSGMCQAFQSMMSLSTVLRARLDPLMLAGDVESIADDLCFDPRLGHRLGREQYAPDEAYTARAGIPAGTTIRVLREAGLLSPGTDAPQIEWDSIPDEIDNGPVELPMVVTDGWDPKNMSDKGEVGWPVNPLALRGGHSTACAGTFRGRDGDWYLRGGNHWAAWGWNGYFSIPLELAKWGAIDKPRVLLVPDIEWYAEHDEWRKLLCLKTDLDAWLKEAA